MDDHNKDHLIGKEKEDINQNILQHQDFSIFHDGSQSRPLKKSLRVALRKQNANYVKMAKDNKTNDIYKEKDKIIHNVEVHEPINSYKTKEVYPSFSKTACPFIIEKEKETIKQKLEFPMRMQFNSNSLICLNKKSPRVRLKRSSILNKLVDNRGKISISEVESFATISNTSQNHIEENINMNSNMAVHLTKEAHPTFSKPSFPKNSAKEKEGNNNSKAFTCIETS